MLKDNSALAIERGYTHFSANRLPTPHDRNTAARALTRLQRDMFYKQVVNPTVGRIGIYIEPSDIFDQNGVSSLLQQVDEIVANPVPQPDVFWGQRSPVFRLRHPVDIPLGADHPARQIDALQFKGFLYKPLYAEEICFPIMREYLGIGNPINDLEPMPDGRIKFGKAESRPFAALTLERALNEFIFRMVLGGMFACISPAYAVCEFEDLSFSDRTGNRKRVGFTINFIEGMGMMRTIEFFAFLLKDIAEPERRAQIIARQFMMMGTILSLVHRMGYTLGFPHPDNFSFLSKPTGLQTMLHDFDLSKHVGDENPRVFVVRVLLDIYRAIEIIGKASLLRQHEGALLNQARKIEGFGEEFRRQVTKKDEETRAIFNAVEIEKADPVVNFFKGYFSNRRYTNDERMAGAIENTLENVYRYCWGTAEYKDRLAQFRRSLDSLSADDAFLRRREEVYRWGHFLLESHFTTSQNPFLEATLNFLTASVVEQLDSQGLIPQKELRILIAAAEKSWAIKT